MGDTVADKQTHKYSNMVMAGLLAFGWTDGKMKNVSRIIFVTRSGYG